VAKIILDLELEKESYWYNKANAFSLIIALYEKYNDVKKLGKDELRRSEVLINV
jgi:hypothetical protein